MERLNHHRWIAVHPRRVRFRRIIRIGDAQIPLVLAIVITLAIVVILSAVVFGISLLITVPPVLGGFLVYFVLFEIPMHGRPMWKFIAMMVAFFLRPRTIRRL